MSTTSRPLLAPDSLQLVGDLTRPWGTNWIEVEGVSLVVNLDGTGSDPPPSIEREMIEREMQVRKVRDNKTLLASDDTSIAIVRGLIPPGAEKGDRIDIDIRTPARSKTNNLDGGWAMLTRMREYVLLNDRLSQGHVLGFCQGHILVDAKIEGSDDPVLLTRGRILGGGVVNESRDLGLRVRDEHLTLKTSSHIGGAINQRFHLYTNGDKQGVATPRRDTFISLKVHPRYRDNLVRYMSVIEHIAVRETSGGMVDRMKTLETRLLDPETASEAAVQLEAIGVDAVPVLRNGMNSANAEIRFYAAEALGYLDDPSAAIELAKAVRHEPAFRWRGLHALGAMDQIESQDELALLLHEESAETRYGAFRTLQRLSPNDPLIQGETLESKMRLHKVGSTATPIVHFSKRERPEMVLFGEQFPLQPPVTLFAGSQIVVKSTADGRLRVRKLTSDNNDATQIVSRELDEMVRAIIDLGGSYTDVIQAVTQARTHGCLEARVVFSAIPQPGRRYKRKWDDEADREAKAIVGDEETTDQTNGVDFAAARDDVGSTMANASQVGVPPPVAAPVTLVDPSDLPSGAMFDDDPDVLLEPAAVIDQIRSMP